ncbi:MAG: LCP family protein [Patescibacteria group bacterium]
MSYTLTKGERISTILKDMGNNSSEEPLSVLVLGQVGLGQGGQWHFAPDLVDTIILLHFNPETGVVNLISLPRDLYGDFGESRIKINKVVSSHKTEGLLKILPEITGIEVDKYVVLNLELVKEVVDGLGGIKIDLAEPVYDPVGSFSLDTGTNYLNGEDTAWLIRNRYAPEGDFFREKNQHLVLGAIFTKFDSLSSFKKTSFLFRMLPQISKSTSNFRLGETISDFREIDKIQFNSIVLDFNTELWQSTSLPSLVGEGEYVLIPKAGINEYEKVKEYIQEHLQ